MLKNLLQYLCVLAIYALCAHVLQMVTQTTCLIAQRRGKWAIEPIRMIQH